jgi:phage I-like protein
MSPKIFGAGVLLKASRAPDKGPVWEQVALAGQYKGYDRGKRTINFDRALFDQVVRNFHAHPQYKAGPDGVGAAKVVPWDYEHTSERDPIQGNVPLTGLPAPAWVLDLQVRGGPGKEELWALTELGDQAREQIQNEEYLWASVAISPDDVDPISGKNVGHVLTSVAFTNKPFLQGLGRLVASMGGADNLLERLGQLLETPAESTGTQPGETMEPKTILASLARVMKVRDSEEAILAAAELGVAHGDLNAQLVALFGVNDPKAIPSAAAETIKLAKQVPDLVARLQAAEARLGEYDQAAAAHEVDAIAASMNLDQETAGRFKPLLLSARLEAGKDATKLAAFRAQYPVRIAPQQGGAVYTAPLLASQQGAQYGGPATGYVPPQVPQAPQQKQGNHPLLSCEGVNLTQKAQFYLAAKRPGFKELSSMEQAFQAGRYLKEEGAPIL